MNILRYLLPVLILPLPVLPLFAQGDLAPTDPPGPVMKTLQQVEPRTDLATVGGDSTAMHIIENPGSYYLSGNIDATTTNGIVIQVSGVTLDLGGFSILRSTPDAAFGSAILLDTPRLTNIAIKNGHITSGIEYDGGAAGDQFTGPGFQNGISETTDPDPTNVRVSHVHVAGCDLDGINLGFSEVSNTVEHCSVKIAGGNGIVAGEVLSSTSLTCGNTGIAARGNVISCRAESVGIGYSAIYSAGNVNSSHGEALDGTGITCERCVTSSFGKTSGTGTSADGISANYAVSDSYGMSAGDDGIDSLGNVSNCYGVTTGTGTGADGIHTFSNVINSHGESQGDDGIHSFGTVSNSEGIAFGTGTDSDGIVGAQVTNSYGQSAGDDGIDAGATVANSTGFATGASTDSHGIRSGRTVANCYGQASVGDGITANNVISYSHGVGLGTGVGLRSTIGVGCTFFGGEAITFEYLMP